MTANPNALVALPVASRETGIPESDLQALIDGDDIEVIGGHGYVYRHSVEKLKVRAARFGGTGQ